VKAGQITDEEALDRALGADVFLLFKHSRSCPISARAFREYEAFLAAREGLATGWIDVVAQRSWSQRVAAATGVPHQSPQALLVRGGRVAWNASHYDITAAAMERAFA
jgi:bacillithiol system protein YtxJ